MAIVIQGDVDVAERITVLKVRGIHCEGCAGNIEGALRAIEGVKEVKVDIGHSKVSVKYDADSANQDEVKDGIRKAGYVVS